MTRDISILLKLSYFFLIVTSCADISDSRANDAKIINNISKPIFSSAELKLLLYDAIDLSNDSIFSDIIHIEVDREEKIYLLTSNSEIIKFNDKHEIDFVLNSKGNGPGEFSGSIFTFDIFEDTVFVADNKKGEILKFDTFGNYLTATRFPNYITPSEITRVKDGFFCFLFQFNLNEKGIQKRVSLEKYDIPLKANKIIYQTLVNQGFQSPYNPFNGNLRYLITDSVIYIYESNPDKYKIFEFNYSGIAVSIINKNYAKTKVTQKEKQKLMKGFNFYYGDRKIRLDIDYYNSIDNMFLDKNGYLWIQTIDKFDVIKNGKYYCSFKNDFSNNNLFITGEYLFLTQNDSLFIYDYKLTMN